MSEVRSVVLVDAVRTPFGKAGSMYAGTRADDLMVRAMRGLLERNPKVDPASIDDVAIAAATQTGDQGMNIGRSATLLAGLPKTVPGYSIDRWCAGALTATTTVAGAIAMGAIDIAIAGGVEHMGNHPMGELMDPNPRYLAEKLVELKWVALSLHSTQCLPVLKMHSLCAQKVRTNFAASLQMHLMSCAHQSPQFAGSLNFIAKALSLVRKKLLNFWVVLKMNQSAWAHS